MKHRIHDPATLDAMAPLIRPIVDDLQEAYDEVLRAAGRGDGSIERELEVVQRHAFELEDLGATVRSLEPLIVEFLVAQDGVIGSAPWCPHEGRAGAFRPADGLYEEALAVA